MPDPSEPEPERHLDVDADATSRALSARLRARIARDGPIPFADFMETALYDDRGGFYARPPVGEDAHFVTSPHVSPVFGRLLARQLEELWTELGRPRSLRLVEAGAGDGTLAAQILDAVPPALAGAVEYLAVERSAGARRALASRGLTVVSNLDDVGRTPCGCLLANELLDNLPIHRVRRTSAGLVEIRVGVDGDRFVEVPADAPPTLARAAPALEVGAEAAVSLEAPELLLRSASLFERGYGLFFDYGTAEPGMRAPEAHAYRSHRLEPDVLARPGTADITAGVDFAALADAARRGGLAVWGPVTQRSALLALGFRDVEVASRQQQVRAIEARRGIEAMRIYSARSRANQLLAGGGLGDFLVLGVGVGVDADVVPRAFTASAEPMG